MRALPFIATSLLSALALFTVQPMAGKALLPLLGGTAGAWTICLLFFQSALLLGYTYVWVVHRLLGPKARMALHLSLLSVPLWTRGSFAFPEGLSTVSSGQTPSLFALAFLAMNVGLPFALLSTTAPMVQSYFSIAFPGQRPYFLYAASNIGSLGALVAYPFLIEPALPLAAQAQAFDGLYLVVVLGVTITAIIASLTLRGSKPQKSAASESEPVSPKTRLRWIALAFMPSLLLAGSSTHLCMDLAPLPLLWVLPLGIYLGSFVLAFARWAPVPPTWLGRGACLIAVVLIFITLSHGNEPLVLIVALHMLFLGAASWIAHRRLAERAPTTDHLPEYYVWIALGGALGTLISALIAPLLLPDLWEYPVSIALACSLRSKRGMVIGERPFSELWSPIEGSALEKAPLYRRLLRSDLPHLFIVVALRLLAGLLGPFLADTELASLMPIFIFGPATLYAYRWMPLRRRFTWALIALIAASAAAPTDGNRLSISRSFFGVLRVIDDNSGPVEARERHLLHGTTLHGSQSLSRRDVCEPLGYYSRRGALGSALSLRQGPREATLAIGLGTGAVACYCQPTERFVFAEINEAVVEIANDNRLFTFLDNAPCPDVQIRLMDGRLAVAEEPNASLDLIVLDAFNSDSVPVHLLTRQALQLYVDRLRPGGWVLVHLSNRILNLEQVLSDGVVSLGLEARVNRSELGVWAAVSRPMEGLDDLDDNWQDLPEGRPAQAWTDQRSSLLSALRF